MVAPIVATYTRSATPKDPPHPEVQARILRALSRHLLSSELLVYLTTSLHNKVLLSTCYLDLFKALTSMSGPLCRCAVRPLLGILSRFNE
jgi:hypothetical protein